MPQEEHSRGELAAKGVRYVAVDGEFVLNKSCQPWLELQALVGASAAAQKAGEQPRASAWPPSSLPVAQLCATHDVDDCS